MSKWNRAYRLSFCVVCLRAWFLHSFMLFPFEKGKTELLTVSVLCSVHMENTTGALIEISHTWCISVNQERGEESREACTLFDTLLGLVTCFWKRAFGRCGMTFNKAPSQLCKVGFMSTNLQCVQTIVIISVTLNHH